MRIASGKNRIMQTRHFSRAYRLVAFVLCLCISFTLLYNSSNLLFPSAAAADADSNATSGVIRQADPSTMDTYKDVLNLDENTRYAGQLWMDKSVFAYGADDYGDRKDRWKNNTLTLDENLDGVGGSIKLNEDFLHVYSAVGSSQELTGVPPVRTVIVFDNSGSMYNSISRGNLPHDEEADKKDPERLWNNQRIALTVESINRAIDTLMETGAYNEVAVVLFGDGAAATYESSNSFAYNGHSTAVTILPMKHYKPQKTVGSGSNSYTPYLNAGWNNGAGDFNGDKPNHIGNADKDSIGNGWVFVNNEICGLTTAAANDDDAWKSGGFNGCGNKKYTAYRNGTTNIQAGYYVGMQELLKASKSEKVGGEIYDCVPSLVMLTDGAATDMLTGDFIKPDMTADGAAPTSRGFVNDTGNKLRSFTGATGEKDPKEIGNFWDMFVQREGDKYASAAWYNGINSSAKKLAGQGLENMKSVAETYSDSVASMLLGTLLTTSYYKTKVKKAYNMEPDEDWSIYTISVDMTDPSTIPPNAGPLAVQNGNHNADGSYAGNNVEPKTELPKSWEYDITSNPFTIDPKEYFYKDGKLDISWLKTKGYIIDDNDYIVDLANPDPKQIPYHTIYPDYSVGEMILQGIVKAAAMLKEWENGEVQPTRYQSWQESKGILGSANSYVDGKYVNPFSHGNGYLLEELQTIEWPQLPAGDEVTKNDVVSNIDYNEKAYYAFTKNGDAGGLAQVFVTVLDNIMKPLFQPVNGGNDLGVKNSVTYMDPVGKYMDVKDVVNLSLFGKLYDITRTAVYSYEWNDRYMTNMGEAGLTFPEGWYRGEPTEAEYNGKDPPGGSAKQAWKEGWVYRLSSKTAAEFVPNLANVDKPDKIGEKQRHTEYTFYRIDNLTEEQRRELHMNPAYGTTVPSDVTYSDDGAHREKPGVYALADLRIWVEDTGEYNDANVEEGGSMSDANFDEALWVDIPANMLPLRTVTIDLGAKSEDEDTWKYTTNLNPGDSGYMASFPLRVFYAVGVSDEMRNPDSRHMNLAGTLDQEYIQDNKITTDAASKSRNIPLGNVEFFSNWYNPLNRYDSYATSGTDYTYGDPMVTFSPSTDNRYYIFTKALPLYSRAYVWTPNNKSENANTLYERGQGNWRMVNLQEDVGDDGEDSQIFDPNTFGGRLVAQDLEPADVQGSSEARQNSIWDALEKKKISQVKDGDIILLKNHRLTDVEWKEVGDPFSSSAYFYLPIEYFVMDGTDKAGMEQYVVARKGSEFGSAYEAEGISNGDMLCWHDVSETYRENYPYLSYTNTGDTSRGKNYIGAPLDPETGWYEGVSKGGKPDNPPANNAEYLRDGQWVVSARPGGLRVGNLAQGIKKKGEKWTPYEEEYIAARFPGSEGLSWGYYDKNQTRTSNNYVLPTISTQSNAVMQDIIVNTYLGNNGRLYVSDTTLLTTKIVEPFAKGLEVDKDKEFPFQVFIDGFYGEESAVVVRRNEATNTWQRQYHYIDMELDGKLFLQAVNGNKVMTDDEGCQIISEAEFKPDGSSENYVYAADCKSSSGREHKAGDPYGESLYYVYVGKNEHSKSEIGASATGLRVYHNNNVDGNGSVDTRDVAVEYYDANGDKVTAENPDAYSGMRKFYADKVWLVSKEQYENVWLAKVDGEGNVTYPGYDPVGAESSELTNSTLYSKTIEYNQDSGGFELLTLDPLDPTSSTTEVKVVSPYLTASSYWTKKVYFGYKANPDGTMSGIELTEDDLYDKIIPKADRPAFSGYTNDYMAKHTAEVTLKHGYGLLFSSIPLSTNYRITEKLSPDEDFILRELTHVQQYGSASVYRIGSQEIPTYTRDGATYPSPFENYKTQSGLTWALNKDGSENTAGTKVTYEPFNHTNAVMWECYATMQPGELGNHHHPADAIEKETANFYNGDKETEYEQEVLANPSCAKVDIKQDDGTTIHYMYRNGELVDPHYEGEWSAFLRDANRYIVSPTVHFGVDGEDQDSASAQLPVEPNDAYNGVYSVFGNTGLYEEQAHYVNGYTPRGSIAVEKFGGEGELIEGAGFTLYEKTVGDGGEVTWTEVVPSEPDAPPLDLSRPNEKQTRLVYMQNFELPDGNYDANAQIYTLKEARYPVHKEKIGDKDSLYYFRPKTAYTDSEWEALVKSDPSRVRTVVEFKNLDVTKVYKLQETTVPEGYIITHQPEQEFTFRGEDGERILHMLYEVKNFKPLNLPETGGGTVAWQSAVGALLALLGLALLRKRKRRDLPSP